MRQSIRDQWTIWQIPVWYGSELSYVRTTPNAYHNNYIKADIHNHRPDLPDSHVSTVETSDETLTGDSKWRSGIPFFRWRSGDEVKS